MDIKDQNHEATEKAYNALIEALDRKPLPLKEIETLTETVKVLRELCGYPR